MSKDNNNDESNVTPLRPNSAAQDIIDQALEQAEAQPETWYIETENENFTIEGSISVMSEIFAVVSADNTPIFLCPFSRIVTATRLEPDTVPDDVPRG